MYIRKCLEEIGLSPFEVDLYLNFFQLREEHFDTIAVVAKKDPRKLSELLESLVRKSLVIKCEGISNKDYYTVASPEYLEKYILNLKKKVEERAVRYALRRLEEFWEFRNNAFITLAGINEDVDFMPVEGILVKYMNNILPSLDLRVGSICNMNCLYCLMGTEKKFQRPLKELAQEMMFAREIGVEKVGFTGGEPTIRKDIFQSISIAKKLGFSWITVYTNGLMFYDKEFTRMIWKKGVNQIGSCLDDIRSDVLEHITRRKGVKGILMKAFHNMFQYKDWFFSFDIVVNKLNYKNLVNIVNQFMEWKEKYGVTIFVNLEYVNPQENAWVLKDKIVPRMSDAVPYMQESLKFAWTNNFPLGFRSVPLCLMQGYEKYCLDCYMGIYTIYKDKSNNPVFSNIFEEFINMKSSRCWECKYLNKCKGFPSGYYEIYKDSEFKPIK